MSNICPGFTLLSAPGEAGAKCQNLWHDPDWRIQSTYSIMYMQSCFHLIFIYIKFKLFLILLQTFNHNFSELESAFLKALFSGQWGYFRDDRSYFIDADSDLSC